jgi:hypothetical protein
MEVPGDRKEHASAPCASLSLAAAIHIPPKPSLFMNIYIFLGYGTISRRRLPAVRASVHTFCLARGEAGSARFRSCRGQHAGLWLAVFPTTFHTTARAAHYRIALRARLGFWLHVGLYALCAEEGQFLRFEQNFGRFLRFTHIWMK